MGAGAAIQVSEAISKSSHGDMVSFFQGMSAATRAKLDAAAHRRDHADFESDARCIVLGTCY